jgi:hypothetical protein
MTKIKGKPNRKTYKGMVDLKTLFEKRINVFLGLTRDEIISLFYNLPEDKVLKLKKEAIETKWSEIRTIKKYLLWKDKFPIIFKNMPRGTELYDDVLGRRTLDKRINVFFRCSDIESAGKWRDTFHKMAISFDRTGSKPSDIVEEEQIQIPIVQTIQN